VNSVDSGNTAVPVLVIECGHCGGAQAYWWSPSPGNPPDLWFKNFPKNGRAIFSNKTVLVACERCQRQLDVIRSEYQKTLAL